MILLRDANVSNDWMSVGTIRTYGCNWVYWTTVHRHQPDRSSTKISPAEAFEITLFSLPFPLSSVTELILTIAQDDGKEVSILRSGVS